MKTTTLTISEYERRMAQREAILKIGHAVIGWLELISSCFALGAGAVAAWFMLCLLLV